MKPKEGLAFDGPSEILVERSPIKPNSFGNNAQKSNQVFYYFITLFRHALTIDYKNGI